MTNDPLAAYFSVFIAYSGKDQDLARRLHDDLQNAGIRTWFAPQDLKAGERIRDAIDQAIRRHDKILLILSESSVESLWVEQEVETALEKEREEDRLVLIPIRIDDSVMSTRESWATKLRRQRHIRNFSHWMEEGAYHSMIKFFLLAI